jgi:hypothetical protein
MAVMRRPRVRIPPRLLFLLFLVDSDVDLTFSECNMTVGYLRDL